MKYLRIFGYILVAIFVLYLCRRPLLRLTGDYLIEEDPAVRCQALFVLSGGPDSRAAEASRLFKKGYVPYIVCTGESAPYLFDILDIKMDEADLTRRALNKNSVSDRFILLVHAGTSTREEKEIIIKYCKMKGLKKVMVLSDKFHTKRIDHAFRDDFEREGIEMVLRGAPSKAYEESNWWATESGMIMVNNEYIKLFYYFLHY